MTSVTLEGMELLLRTFNVQNAENMKVMTETTKQILHNKKDIDKVCRPGIFKGVEGKTTN